MNGEIRKILVTGALGQIGTELTFELRKKYGIENVIASDLRDCDCSGIKDSGPFYKLDILQIDEIENIIKKHEVDTIVHLAALLSAVGEDNPHLCWNVNMNGTVNVLNLGVKYELNRVFVPSSIAVWGPDCEKTATQKSPVHPTTMYGVTKVAGEVLGNYYFEKFGLDVRGLRYPGIISSETLPGGGTTDYAVAIYYGAVLNNRYTCFVNKDTRLPMMYMPDCLKATLDLMEAPLSGLNHHCDYNVGSMSFDVTTLENSIKKYKPDFKVIYEPDDRQKIADSWPDEVDDRPARNEWNWKPVFDLDTMTRDMLTKLEIKHSDGKI